MPNNVEGLLEVYEDMVEVLLVLKQPMKSLANTVRRKKRWVTAEILDMSVRWKTLRKKRFEPEGSEKYREVNNSIKRCPKKAKENWIGEQCSETEKI